MLGPVVEPDLYARYVRGLNNVGGALLEITHGNDSLHSRFFYKDLIDGSVEPIRNKAAACDPEEKCLHAGQLLDNGEIVLSAMSNPFEPDSWNWHLWSKKRLIADPASKGFSDPIPAPQYPGFTCSLDLFRMNNLGHGIGSISCIEDSSGYEYRLLGFWDKDEGFSIHVFEPSLEIEYLGIAGFNDHNLAMIVLQGPSFPFTNFNLVLDFNTKTLYRLKDLIPDSYVDKALKVHGLDNFNRIHAEQDELHMWTNQLIFVPIQ